MPTLDFAFSMPPLHVLDTSEITKLLISCKTASGLQRPVYIIHTFNRISGGDRSD